MTRLNYETRAGQVSESDTFAQLLEYLRLAEEACYTIGHLRKANSDNLVGQGFLAYGQILAKTRDTVLKLMTGSRRALDS